MKPFAYRFLLCVVTMLPESVLAQGVTMLDTVYTPLGYQDGALTATIFIPSPSSSNGVGVVLARYTIADRLTAKVWCDTLAARGYLAMTIDYGNLDTSFYPKPQRAFKTAVEFLRRNDKRFSINTNKIVGFGQSQGSLIWGQTMIWDNDDAYFGTDPAVNDRLNAAVLLYGAYDMFFTQIAIQDTILRKHFSQDPTLRGTKGQCILNTNNITTPLLLIHGTSDQTVSIIHSRRLRDSLQSHGNTVELIELNGASHVFDMAANGSFTGFGLTAKDSVLAFLKRFSFNGVAQVKAEIPAKFVLWENYPNPFNPSTTIRFELPHRSHVNLKIYSVLGQEIATLVNEEIQPGTYDVRWDATWLASGAYLYRLETAEFVQTRKLLLIR